MLAAFVLCESRLWIRARIDAQGKASLVGRGASLPPPSALLQRQVVRHLKEPTPQLTSIAPKPEMTAQSQECLLDDVLSFLGTQSERCDIAQQL
jgi:hypothetical protein